MEGLRFRDPLLEDRKLPIVIDETLDKISCPTMIKPYTPGACPKDFAQVHEIRFDKRPIFDNSGRILHKNEKISGILVTGGMADEAVLLYLAFQKLIFNHTHATTSYFAVDSKSKEKVFMMPNAQWKLNPHHKYFPVMARELDLISSTSKNRNKEEVDYVDQDITLGKLFRGFPRGISLASNLKYGPPLPIFRFKEEEDRYLVSKSII